MRTKYAIINMLVGVGGQILNLILSFVTRIVFVHYLSEAYLGVNGLFTDVLGLLNLAELGVGTAMIFSLYEPAARNDHKQLTRLMNLYRRLYRIVALCVLLFGAVLLPFLHVFIKGGEGIEHLLLVCAEFCWVVPAQLQELHLFGLSEGLYPHGSVSDFRAGAFRRADSDADADGELHSVPDRAVCDTVHSEHSGVAQSGSGIPLPQGVEGAAAAYAALEQEDK